MMTVTTALGGQDHHPRAQQWFVDDHGVLILSDDKDETVAVYAAGAWSAVNLDRPPK